MSDNSNLKLFQAARFLNFEGHFTKLKNMSIDTRIFKLGKQMYFSNRARNKIKLSHDSQDYFYWFCVQLQEEISQVVHMANKEIYQTTTNQYFIIYIILDYSQSQINTHYTISQ